MDEINTSIRLQEIEANIARLQSTQVQFENTHNEVNEIRRQLQTLQGGTGTLEPLSSISAWKLDTPGTVATDLNTTFVTQAQMLLAGRGITFSHPAQTPFLQIDASGNLMNIDYVVASDGTGTHTALYGASGALTAAIATGASRTIWLCTTHVETVSSQYSIAAFATNQQVVVLSAGFNRPVITIGSGLSTSALMIYATANSGTGSVLRFQGFTFRRETSDGASAGPLITGDGGWQTPEFEHIDLDFEGNGWNYLLWFESTGSVSLDDIVFKDCRAYGTITAIIRTNSVSATVGEFVMDNCDWANLGSISDRAASTAVDAGFSGIKITNNLFRIVTGYLWQRTYNYPFVMHDNRVLDYQGTVGCVQIGTAGTTDPSDATITANHIYCSVAGSSAVTITGGAGTAANIAVVGNDFRGPGSGTAIEWDIANSECASFNSYRGWTTNDGGSVGPGTGTTVATHNFLSATHPDTLAGTVVAGDIIIGNATPKWARLGVGAAGTILTVTAGLPAWVAPAAAVAHTILSATHTDSLAASVVDGDIIIGNVTPAWSRLAITIPAVNVRNILGIDNAELRPSWKTALDATAPSTSAVGDSASAGTSLVFSHRDHVHGREAFAVNTIALSTAAAAGVATTLIRSDATIVAFDATVPTTIAESDAATVGVINFAARRDHRHGAPATWAATAHNILSATHGDSTGASVVRGDVITGQGVVPKWVRLAISVPAANVRNVFGADNGDTEPAWKTALDSTNPTTIGIADAAAPGTSLVFSHRDHQHASPSTWTATAHNILSATHGDSAAASVVDGDVIIGNVTPAWSRLAISVPAANVLNVLGVANTELRPSWKSIFDSTNPTTIAEGAAAASGTSLIASHRDHTHGAPTTWAATAHNVLSATHGDALAGSVVDGDIIIGNVTPKWSRLAITIPAANVRNVLGIDNAELRPSWKVALDATNPTTIGISDVAAPGTSLIFSHRDHQHGSPATWTATAHNLLSAIHGDTLAASVVAGDLMIGNATPKWARLGIGSNGQVLQVVAGAPAWGADPGGAGGTTSIARTMLLMGG